MILKRHPRDEGRRIRAELVSALLRGEPKLLVVATPLEEVWTYELPPAADTALRREIVDALLRDPAWDEAHTSFPLLRGVPDGPWDPPLDKRILRDGATSPPIQSPNGPITLQFRAED